MTPELAQIVSRAERIAASQNCGSVEEAHLFLAVLNNKNNEDSLIATLLTVSGVAREEARLYALSAVQTEGKRGKDRPKLTPNARRILRMARQEANRVGSLIIEEEHLFIACVRQQSGPHLGEVLRPLGLDASQLRAHLRGLTQSDKSATTSGPLKDLTDSSQRALEAAHTAMRASFCGQISTAHLLLGVLSDTEDVAVETLRLVGIDVEALKREVQESIFSDGQIATTQKKFSPAAKRALQRAKREAKEGGQELIGVHHMLSGLLPRPASAAEKLAFGHALDDPLEKVWVHWPTEEIQRYYEALWKNTTPYRRGNPLDRLTPASLKALEAAQYEMRVSSCGTISTAHLLLGLLDDVANPAAQTLREAGVNAQALKGAVREIIVPDGQIATPQMQFSRASQRALDRASREAVRSSLIGPQHLLIALLPRASSMEEQVAFGSALDDPLEQVWPNWPNHEIQRAYKELWKQKVAARRTPTHWIRVDSWWALGGICWWLWPWVIGWTPFLLGFGLALFLAISGEGTKNYLLRDRYGSFIFGVLVGGFLSFFLVPIL